MLKVNIENISIIKSSGYHLLLKNISFDIVSGKIFTILGTNGSGKSTLIKALTALLNKNIYSVNGNVFWDDKDLLNTDYKTLRSIRADNIKYVFQDSVNSFDPLKTFGYYFNFINNDKNKIDKLLKYFLLPAYDKLSKLYPYEVSGGMAQRLSFILAFLSNPGLIILDEPTSGIDYTIANLLLIKLKEFVDVENHSVLLVTQDVVYAEKVSDEIAFLANNTLSGFKNKDDFLSGTDNPALTEFLNSYKELK